MFCVLPSFIVNRLTWQFHTDGKKRRSFLSMLFAAGELQRWAFAK